MEIAAKFEFKDGVLNFQTSYLYF